MSRHDERVIGQRKQFTVNARDDLLHRGSAEIPSPNRTGEERIAREHSLHAVVFEAKADAARRVARRVEHFDAHGAGFDMVAVVHLAIECDDRRRVGKPDPSGLKRKRLVERQIGRMQQRRPSGAGSERPEIADVIDVCVGVEQVFGAQMMPFEAFGYLRDAVAAVDNDCLTARFLGKDRAVAAKRADRKGFDNHGPRLRRAGHVRLWRCGFGADSLGVDIQAEIAAIQGRISQITQRFGAPPPAPAGSFAGMVNSLTASAGSPPAALAWPLQGTITSPFGERKNPLGPGEDFHPGIDIAADSGTPIAAAAPGRVISAGPDAGYGNLVVVDDGNGVTTRYAHCSQILVRPGQLVNTGDTLATVGSTGASTGPHLHFEVRVDDKPIDPMGVLPPAN